MRQSLISCLLKRSLTQKNTSFCVRRYLCTSHVLQTKSGETELLKQLTAKIKLTGPISFAEYMKEVLINPTAGYYMNRDVFGSDGDFTTSPEISQMFGELLGIWCVHEWMALGKPSQIQLVELGPGRGTLASDMCRIFSKFEGIKDAVTLHLVEVSPKLSDIQEQTLSGKSEVNKDSINHIDENAETHYKESVTMYGQPVYWHNRLYTVPEAMSFFIAHEFFDALPIHKFQKKDDRWHELLVDIDQSEEGPHHLRFGLSRERSVAQELVLKVPEGDTRDHIEVCPEGGAYAQTIAHRISRHGGGALLIDYGHNGEKTDTVRAFKNHTHHPLLAEPGAADLTADVDFAYLKSVAKDIVNTHGPITQKEFLFRMGIRERMQILLKNATPEQQKDHLTAFNMLTHPEQMGERFKFLCYLPKPNENNSEEYIPAGFKDLY